nr:MAG TPA: Helix-turn-helix XRE-family like protein [Caudoviricetes sp.]
MNIKNDKFLSIKKEVGQKLLSIRKELGYNQQNVASAIGISRAALSYYEKGERSVDIETLYKLATFYNISIDYLFGLKDSSSPEYDISSINEMKELGLSSDALDNMWGNPDFVMLINDLATHKDFQELEELTYHSRYTHYENIDNGYRSFLTSKLLYSMIAEIFTQWYSDNPNRISELSKEEKQKLINDIEAYFKDRKRVSILYETGKYPEAIKDEAELNSNLRILYSKLKKYL